MEYSIEEFFKGSKSQLINLGKQATRIHRELYGTDPNTKDHPTYGKVNVYQEVILQTLPKPEPSTVTDVYCRPRLAKDIPHFWEMKFKRYNEYETKLIRNLKGELKSLITYEKGDYGWVYKFKLYDNKITYHVQMNDTFISKQIVSALINTSLGDNILLTLQSQSNGWPVIIITINDIPVKKTSVKMTSDEINHKIDKKNKNSDLW